jgi:TolA-binding protein
LYRRGEILLGSERYAEAQTAFSELRSEYPESELVDESLFLAGRAADLGGEPSGALLVWERLIEEFPASPFRFEAMQNSAEIYEQRDEYRNALNLYTELQSAYAQRARGIDVGQRINRLVLIINGLSERESELVVRIEARGGASTAEGREAILELARLLIFESADLGEGRVGLVSYLEALAEAGNAGAAERAEALSLLGEYRARLDERVRAADAFLESAAVSGAPRDRVAASLLRAAEMYRLAGRRAEVREIVTRISESFPDTEWQTQAQNLLEGGSR